MKRKSKEEIKTDIIDNADAIKFNRAAAFEPISESVYDPPALPGELSLPHAIRYLTDSEFKNRQTRYKARPSQFGKTVLFKHDGKNILMGEEAANGEVVRQIGPKKYVKGYFDHVVLGCLLKLFPDGHDNIILSYGHSADAIQYVEGINEMLKGLHTIERYDGQKVSFRIRARIPWDEPAGGLWRFLTKPDAAYNPHDLAPGMKIGVVDIGGGVSSFYPAMILEDGKPEILWNQGQPFGLGIQDVMHLLQEEMQSLEPELFRVRTIPESIRHEALRRSGITTVRNHDVDVTQAYNNATAKLLDGVRGVYDNKFDGGLDLNLIVVTGGGGGLLFNGLQIELGHDDIFLADNARTINFANMRGAAWATEVWAMEDRNLDKMKPGTAIVVGDFGNSDFKLMTLNLKGR
jgi:hypothetical protein